ncbi:MAG: hypothetical protein WC188_04520 [Candidatus Caldatribacteriota bacterium]|nr:hypothetical protein [Patescibacteria group bacterium]
MTVFDISDEKFPSVSLLIKTAFQNYEIAITKYEKLLVDNISFNVFVREKLEKLPIESEIRKVLEEFVKDADKRVQYQQDKLEVTEKENNKSVSDLMKNINSNLKDLIFKFKIIMGWLAIVSVVGSGALAYINYANKLTKSSERMARAIPDQTIHYSKIYPDKTGKLFFEYLDANGNLVKVPIDVNNNN